MQDSFARSRLGSQFLFDANAESVDVAALCLLLNKIILKESSPGLVMWSNFGDGPSSEEVSVVGWACVPIVLLKDKSQSVVMNNGNTSLDSSKPTSSSSEQLVNRGNLVLQLGFSSVSAWENYKQVIMQAKAATTATTTTQPSGTSMDDNESLGGETIVNLQGKLAVESLDDDSNEDERVINLKLVTLTAARSLRHWIRNQKRLLLLQQRNNSYNVIRYNTVNQSIACNGPIAIVVAFLDCNFFFCDICSTLCGQVSNGLTAASQAIDNASVTSIDSLAAALAFLFRGSGSSDFSTTAGIDDDNITTGRSVIKSMRYCTIHE